MENQTKNYDFFKTKKKEIQLNQQNNFDFIE